MNRKITWPKSPDAATIYAKLTDGSVKKSTTKTTNRIFSFAKDNT
ncbi:hypothetical protein CAXC1_150010 [Candidatus Xenohaliotis californiensis]|uniref:Uncharacterized protein n=1 Tax=Candidatus Xenohaliotis californiensis TaxID=84677 RepID=A0ABP0EU23_9RICK|nr:hypothetical protein CAXC1_150010 [Candidatus Xenohaliotis californiensis]